MRWKKAALLVVLLLASLAYARNYGSGPYGRGTYGLRTGTVAFTLELNINGSANDTAEVDSLPAGFYTAGSITNYYGCVQDTNISSSPAFGLVFSGKSLDYINLTANTTEGNSFRVTLSQNLTGNRFVIPATQTGCAVISNRFSDIASLGYMPSAFVKFTEGRNRLEVSLPLHGIDLVGDFSKRGAMRIALEKNETDQIVQITGDST